MILRAFRPAGEVFQFLWQRQGRGYSCHAHLRGGPTSDSRLRRRLSISRTADDPRLRVGYRVNALGHSHPKLVQALQDQVGTLWHTSNLTTSRNRPPSRSCSARRPSRIGVLRQLGRRSGRKASSSPVNIRAHRASGKYRHRVQRFVPRAFFCDSISLGKSQNLDGFGPETNGSDQALR